MKIEEITTKQFNLVRKKLVKNDIDEMFHDTMHELMMFIKNKGFLPEEGMILAEMLKEGLKSYIKFDKKERLKKKGSQNG